MTSVRRTGGELGTQQSRAWTRRKVLAANAVAQTYVRSLSSTVVPTMEVAGDGWPELDTVTRS